MARKQKPTEPESGSKKATPSRWRRAADVLVTTMSTLVLVGIVIGLLIGRETMIKEASRLKGTPAAFTVEWPPLAVPPGGIMRRDIDGVPNTWLDVKSRLAIEELIRTRLTGDPFDTGTLRSVQEALLATGWFDGVCNVVRADDGVVHVTGEWREPVAAVRHGDTDYIVASRGERLPAEYQPDGSGLKAVIGPQMPPPERGETWIGGDVQAGLTLLDFLRTMPFSHQVAAVDISEYNARKRLLIITDRGSTIVWGGEPGHFHPGQAREEIKRSRLMQLFRQSGRIDQGQDVLNVSLSSGY